MKRFHINPSAAAQMALVVGFAEQDMLMRATTRDTDSCTKAGFALIVA
jgi:hypothetical protein